MLLRIQHAWQGQSGTGEDRYVNTFYCQPPTTPTEIQYADITDAIKDFYTAPAAPSTEPLTYWMAADIDGAGRSVKMYDMADPPEREPVWEDESSPTLAYSGQNLPAEVALCLSYAAIQESGQANARRRGRIYIGPLNIRAMGAAGGNAAQRPDASFMYAMLNAAQKLRTELFDAGGGAWSVYSPTNEAALAIVRCWVDDAWDTQRRRGHAPTDRQTKILV